MKKYNIYHQSQLVRQFVDQETIIKQFKCDDWKEAKEALDAQGYTLKVAK